MKRLSFLLALCMVLCGTAVLRAEEKHAVDDEGFIRNWLLLAPIMLEDSSDAIDKEFIKEEGKLAPKDGDKAKVGDTELVWKKIKAADYYYDVNELIPERQDQQACSYAVCYIVADEEIKAATLQMSSNDHGKLYLNGKELVKHSEGRSIDKDQSPVENVTLPKGVNVIVHKVVNTGGNWQGALRFTDKAGKPIKSIKIQMAK